MFEKSNAVAILIDADNTEARKMELILKEVSTRGRIILKRAYGNWSKDILSPWEEVLKKNAIKAVQQYDYVAKKNATDMALVIDAMDLLSTGLYGTFVLVSSDSDFTPLAIKLREAGAIVIGAGKSNTPQPFKNSCDEFINTENLIMKKEKEASSLIPTEISDDIDALIHDAWNRYKDDDGWANAASVGNYLIRIKPDFDPRTYGFNKLSELIKSNTNIYKSKMEHNPGGVGIFLFKCLN